MILRQDQPSRYAGLQCASRKLSPRNLPRERFSSMAPRRPVVPPELRPGVGVLRPCGPRPEISEFDALRNFKPVGINSFTRGGKNDRNARDYLISLVFKFHNANSPNPVCRPGRVADAKPSCAERRA